jgi:hypothetical protein
LLALLGLRQARLAGANFTLPTERDATQRRTATSNSSGKLSPARLALSVHVMPFHQLGGGKRVVGGGGATATESESTDGAGQRQKEQHCEWLARARLRRQIV